MTRLSVLLAACALLLAACAGGGGGASPSPGASGPLAFEAPLLDGGTFAGSDVEGRDVALWFWAPW